MFAKILYNIAKNSIVLCDTCDTAYCKIIGHEVINMEIDVRGTMTPNHSLYFFRKLNKCVNARY
jgi:hypothetical protein